MAPDPSKHAKLCRKLAIFAIVALSVWCLREIVSEGRNILDGKRAEMPSSSKVSRVKPQRSLIALISKHYELAPASIKINGSFLEITATEDTAKKIVDDAYDFDFSMRELHIEKVVCRVPDTNKEFIYVVSPNFVGLGVTPDLVLCDKLEELGAESKDNLWHGLRALLLNEAEKHVQRYLKSDPENPVLLLNQGILREKAGDADPYSALKRVSSEAPRESESSSKLNRIRLASALVKAIECDTKTSTEEELVKAVRDNIPKDYFQTYLLTRIARKFQDVKGEQLAAAEFDEERDRTYRLFATMIFALTLSTTMFALTCFSRRKFWKLPSPETVTCCPNPCGKIPLIVLLSSGITCILIVILWIQCPPLVTTGGVPLVSVFSPDKVALLEMLHQLATTLPFITLTYLFIHKDLSFSEFFRLRFKSNGYTTKQLFMLGVGGFSICWMIANISMMLSMWFHYPGDTAVTVGTGLLASSHSPLAILFLFSGTAIFAPITEEIIFRGVMNPALRRNLDANTVMVLGALIFAVAHLEFTPWWFVHKFFLGYMNSYLVEKTGSIIPGIINHMLLNAFVVVFLVVCS